MNRIQIDKRWIKLETEQVMHICETKEKTKQWIGGLVRISFKSPLVPNHKGLKGDQGPWTLPCKQRKPCKIFKHKNKMNKQNN